jgi:lipoprotein-anchoring transpeptidase ErfK/SrfK
MSLPSQSSRNATRSSQVHYRRSSAGPIRKIFSILVILGIIILVWYTLIRPRASKITDAEPQTDQQTDQLAGNQPADPTNSSAATEHQPVTINNTPTRTPSRTLPGAGDRPNANQDVDRALGTKPASAHQKTNTDILSQAANQANTPAQSPASTGSSPTTNTNPAGISIQLNAARRLVASGDRVGARKLLSQTLMGKDITHTQAQYLRDELTIINNQLLFSPVVDPNDPMTESYTIKSGDSLSKIAARRELATHWKLIARVNKIADPSKIRLGQSIKLVRGPFHAIVHKSAHRLDIFQGSPADPASWLFIKSFDVGLGSNDGTPVGDFVVSANKLENPGWVNPRDAREQYAPNDPKNPIGEYWIGISGVGKYAPLTSLGLHGTVDPDSIGSNESMGCVRLADDDIATVYELLAEHISRVIIKP